MSAICQRPVTRRLILRPGPSKIRAGFCFMAKFWRSGDSALARRPLRFASCDGSVADLRLDGVDVGSRHLADRGDLAILDPPQAERAGNVAILIEGDRADDTFVFDWLTVLDQLERLGESVLAGMDDLALGI